MSTITFDTLKFAKQLEASGIPAVQAEAFVNAQREILSEALDTSLATKADISEVKGELVLLKWMIGAVLGVAIANFARQYF
jgi:hypothetical protein